MNSQVTGRGVSAESWSMAESVTSPRPDQGVAS